MFWGGWRWGCGRAALAPRPDAANAPRCAAQVGETEKELGGPNAANPFATLIDEAEGLDKIEDLQVRPAGSSARGWGAAAAGDKLRLGTAVNGNSCDCGRV